MKNMHRCRFAAVAVGVAAMVLLVTAPAGALAAEPATESPGGTTEPAPPAEAPAPPPSTGWVPQDPGTETSDDGAAAPTRQGSSLGSGGGRKPAESTGSEAPVSSGSSDYYYEPEASPTAEESTGTSETEASSEVAPVEPPPVKTTVRKGGRVGVAGASAVSLPEPAAAADTASALAAKVVPIANQNGLAASSDADASDSNLALWLVLVVGGLVTLYAAGRLLLGPVEPFRR